MTKIIVEENEKPLMDLLESHGFQTIPIPSDISILLEDLCTVPLLISDVEEN